MYKNILEILEKAQSLGFRVSGIEINKSWSDGLIGELGSPMSEKISGKLTKLNTEFGEVKVSIK